ncbi:tape measure protein [Corynebacterium sp.]|uniref:tape measure protein n=1 Tax=Corynebacterium sp. TaxID=1720 RepID=UPI0025BE9CAA|nr:tape measure protein [Corynebacterium sp.]
MSEVWVPVLASMKGFIAEVNKGAGQASKSAGAVLERDLGEAGKRGGKSAAESLAQQMGQASSKVAAARKKEAAAASDLRVAEEQLDQIRKRGDASSGQIMAAEAKVEDARRRQESASTRLGAAEKDLQAVRDGGEARTSSVVTAENKLEDARLKAEAASDKVAVAEQKAQDARDASLAATQKAEGAEVQLALAKAEHGESSKQATAAEKELERARKQADTATVAAEKAEGQVSRARADSQSATESAEVAELSLAAAQEKSAEAARKAGDAASEAAGETRAMSSELAGAEPAAEGLSLGLGDLAKNAGLAAAAFMGVQGIGDTISAGFYKVSAIEDTTASLGILMGSADEASTLMDDLTESNMKTPYSFDAWSEAGKNLVAFGLEAEDVTDTVMALGEAAAASGKGEQALASMGDAWGKAAASGKISMDLINSLAQGGVNGLTILANHFDVTTEEMQKMISGGTVPMEEAFDALTTGIMEGSDGIAGSTMAMTGVMDEMSQTTSGQLGLLKMSFVNLAGDIMKLLMPAIKTLASAGSNLIGVIRGLISDFLEGEGVMGAFRSVLGTLSPIMKPLAAAVGAVTAALGLMKLGMLAQAGATGIATKATTLFRGALNLLVKHPIVAAIAAVVGALTWFFTSTETGRALWEKLMDALKGAWSWLTGTFAPVFDWIGEKFGLLKAAWEEITAAFSGGDWGTGALTALVGADNAEWIVSTVERVGDALGTVWDLLKQLPALAGGVWDILFNGDYTGLPFGLEEDSGIVDFLFRLRDAAMTVGGILKDTLGGALSSLWDALKNVGGSVLEVGKALGGAWIDALKSGWEAVTSLWEGLRKLWDVLSPLLLPVLKIVGAVVGGVVLGAIMAAAKAFEFIAGVVKIAAGVFSWLVDTVIVPLIGWFGDLAEFLGGALSGAFSGFGTLVEGIWTGIKFAWESILKPVFDALWTVVSTTLGVIGTIILAPLLLAWEVLSWGISAAWENIIKPAWDALSTVISWLWSSVLQPIFGYIGSAWSLLGSAIRAIYDSVIKPAWNAVASAASWLWNTILSPIFSSSGTGWSNLGSGIRSVYDSVIKPAWDSVATAIQWLWNTIFSPVVDRMKEAWSGLGSGIRSVYDSVISPAFDALKNGLSKVRDFFGTVVDGIKGVWERLRSILAKPINFMIREVYNGGILKAWNTIAGFLPGLKEAQPAKEIPGYATGGRISGPGTGTSDDVLMWGSNGEHMWTEAEVQKAGGHGAIYAMREMIAQGDAFTFDGHGGLVSLPNKVDNDAGDLAGAAPGLFLPAFAKGGEIRPEWESQLERGHAYAQKVAPGPYVLGGSSGGAPGGPTDCSGFMSEIADVIIGGPGGTRQWATSTFPGPQVGAWDRGLGPGFSVGIHDDPGGPGGGHTAGTLSAVGKFSAVNVESGGGTGQGATYGGAAVGADHSQFPDKWHLKIGADGAFESGGGGGGPSPAEKSSYLRDKVKDIFDELLNPIKASFASAIGEPPPEWLGIPPEAMSRTKNKTIDFLFDRIEDLGSLLGGAYNKAKDIGSAIADGVSSAASWVGDKATGLFRDKGGWIPNGMSIVRNETGRPEAVLNWEQVEAIKKMIDHFGVGYSPVAEAEKILRNPTEGGSTPQEAVQGGTQVAQHVFAEEMGDKSALEHATDAVFDFFGMGDSLTKKLVTTPANELAPMPDWYTKDQGGDAESTAVDTATAATTASDVSGAGVVMEDLTTTDDLQVTAEVEPAAVAAATAPVPAVAGQSESLVVDLDEIDPDRHKKPSGGPEGYVYGIVQSAQDHGLPASGARIGVATALVEAGDPLQMWANNAVPESLNYPHDAVGSDHDSVGLFQQRDNGAWGTVAQRMDPYDSAGMFFDAMLQKFPNWESMDPGAVAQGVQVSAFPDRYATKMGRAEQLVMEAGLYDSGGTLPPGALAVNLSDSPEHVFTDDAMENFVDATGDMKVAAADLSDSAEPEGPVIAAPEVEAPSIDDRDDDTGRPVYVVVNVDGDEVLAKRVDDVEDQVEINTAELKKQKTARRAVDAGVRLLT